MVSYLVEALSPEDSASLRRIDPAIVAAGFAAGTAGASTYAASVLFRYESGGDERLLALCAHPDCTTGYLIGSDGAIVPPRDAGAQQPGDGALFAPAVLSLPVPEHSANRGIHADGQDWPPAWSQLHHPGVRAESAAELRPSLDFSVPAMRARPADWAPAEGIDGRGVIIGVVDWGCDFAHPALRDDQGRSRIRLLWDQNGTAPAGGLGLGAAMPGGALPGVVFDAADLDRANDTPDPYWAAGYDPQANPYVAPRPRAEEVVHGTHVLGTAGGGSGQATPLPAGVAPGSDLMFVHLRPNALDDATRRGNGGDVVQAAASIFHAAETSGQPCVVNLSMGNNTGPHDGSSVLEQMLDALAARPGRAIVVPAGNNREARLHARGAVASGRNRTLTWMFAEDDTTANTIDLWYETASETALLRLTLQPPQGPPLVQENPGQALLILRDGQRIGSLLTEARPPHAGRSTWLQHIRLEVTPDGAAAAWHVTLALAEEAEPAAGEIQFDAWIDRADVMATSQSRFAPEDAETAGTLDSLACGHRTLCVGAYYSVPPGQAASFFSSEGPTRDGRAKPDVAAPGYQVQAARARGGQLVRPEAPERWPLRVAMSGTSVSAPHVAGLAALLLQIDPQATDAKLHRWITAHTQEAAPAWDRRLGYGRADAAAAIKAATA